MEDSDEKLEGLVVIQDRCSVVDFFGGWPLNRHPPGVIPPICRQLSSAQIPRIEDLAAVAALTASDAVEI